MPPDKALGYLNDEGLWSRLLTVPLEFKIINPAADHKPFNFYDFLVKHQTELIHWANSRIA